MKSLLMEKNLPETHAERAVRYVYNMDGVYIGSCSNFRAASEILSALRDDFNVEEERIIDQGANEYFEAGRQKYSESDLRTLGIEVWLRQKHPDEEPRWIKGPKVSVVVPFYNVGKYLEECLESIVRQTHENLEIILVDDASLDSSRTIAEQFAAQDGRIRIVTHPSNRGLGPARNTGTLYASGDYILFLELRRRIRERQLRRVAPLRGAKERLPDYSGRLCETAPGRQH